MIPANYAAYIKVPYFKELYTDHQIPSFESHIYHLAIENRGFSSVTGEKLSVPRVQKFTVDNFNQNNESNGFVGKVVFILHDPTVLKTAEI